MKLQRLGKQTPPQPMNNTQLLPTELLQIGYINRLVNDYALSNANCRSNTSFARSAVLRVATSSKDAFACRIDFM